MPLGKDMLLTFRDNLGIMERPYFEGHIDDELWELQGGFGDNFGAISNHRARLAEPSWCASAPP